ncbi:hypothetical protein LWI29_035559 [Acer saccharum]|uniref:Uncharacterized protein n=1 Tax=Acer saccharum TaxID=4024 RepID=A0AA39RSK2_ACESA|nr:hypothetical protein LWI29_035559 [Acer saccharum]
MADTKIYVVVVVVMVVAPSNRLLITRLMAPVVVIIDHNKMVGVVFLALILLRLRHPNGASPAPLLSIHTPTVLIDIMVLNLLLLRLRGCMSLNIRLLLILPGILTLVSVGPSPLVTLELYPLTPPPAAVPRQLPYQLELPVLPDQQRPAPAPTTMTMIDAPTPQRAAPAPSVPAAAPTLPASATSVQPLSMPPAAVPAELPASTTSIQPAPPLPGHHMVTRLHDGYRCTELDQLLPRIRNFLPRTTTWIIPSNGNIKKQGEPRKPLCY